MVQRLKMNEFLICAACFSMGIYWEGFHET